MKPVVASALFTACLAVVPLTAQPAAALAPSNDAFAEARLLTGHAGSITMTTADATAEAGEPDHAGPARHSVWFTWTPSASGDALFETCSGGSDTVIAAYQGSEFAALAPIAANDNLCGTQSRIVFLATAGTPYRIAVDTANGPGEAFTLTWAHFVTDSPTPLAGAPILGPRGHRVEVRASAAVTNLAAARAVMDGAQDAETVSAVATDHGVSVINYMDTSDEAEFPSSRQVATPPLTAVHGTFSEAAADGSYVVQTSGVLHLDEPGTWRFHVGSDDGEMLMIGTNDVVVTRCDCSRSVATDTNEIDVSYAGYYPYVLTWYNSGGQSAGEFAAQSPSQVDAGDPPVLVGDIANGGADVFQHGTPALTPLPGTPPLGDPGHVVEFRKSSGIVDSLQAARALFALRSDAAGVEAIARDDGVGTINYLDTGADGTWTTGNRDIATPPLDARSGSFTAAGADGAMAMRARGVLHITEPGLWEFAVSSAGGERLVMGSPFAKVVDCDCERDVAVDTAVVSVPQAGYYPYQLMWFQDDGGDAQVEFFAKGPSDDEHRLVGDVVGGGIAVYQPGPASLKVSRMAATTPSAPTTVTVTALDAVGHPVPTYRGTVRFSSDDPEGTVPPDYTFTDADAGSHTFVAGAVFSAPGRYAITATDIADPDVGGSGPRVAVRPPAPPTPSAVPVRAKLVDVSWEAVAGAAEYRVYRGTAPSGPFFRVADTTALSFSHTRLAPSTTYWFVVRARVNGALSDFSGTASATTPALPEAPASLAASLVARSRATLSWAPVSGASSYVVYRATASGGPYSGIAAVSGTEYTAIHLGPGTTYYFVVRAVADAGKSAASPEASVTTPSSS